MKHLIFSLVFILLFTCKNENKTPKQPEQKPLSALALEVKSETLRSWQSYKKYAWGHDVLKPLSKSHQDWYSEPLYISPIDAYSTLHLMGLTDEAKEIENYVVDSLDFDKDVDAKIFEVNIRILGGLLSMYELSKNQKVLDKAKDFGDRMLPAFNTKTGIPKYWVNLKTAATKGDTLNVAEAGSYTFEMGVLSYYTKDPKYYQAGKKATLAIHKSRSKLGLLGEVIEVNNGEWITRQAHICAGVDSYYEYLYKSYELFGDPELKTIWDESIAAINTYIPEEYDNKLWYGRVNMDTGARESSVVTLYDAFMPGILAHSGDLERAERLQETWDWLWNKYGLEPMIYDYRKEEPNYPVYDLNPEIIESAYYLYHFTKKEKYRTMAEQYWSDIKEHCKTDVAFTSVENVKTMEKRDYMPTFFFAETLKYLYLNFSYESGNFNFDDHLFNTEAHQFRRDTFNPEEAKKRLGF